jgi:hypothetical protein
VRPRLPARYQLNGTFTARRPGTGGANRSESERYGQGAGEYGSEPGVTFIKGTPILLDPAGPVYTAIGAGNLRAYVAGQDDVNHAALADLNVVLALCR